MPTLKEVEGARRGGDCEAALLLANEYVQQNPTDSKGWVELGQIHFRLGNLDEAVAASERAICLAPGDRAVVFSAGRWAAKAGKFQDAVLHFNATERLCDAEEWAYLKNAVCLFRGFCLLQLARYDEAREDAEECENDGDVHFCGGVLNRRWILDAVREAST